MTSRTAVFLATVGPADTTTKPEAVFPFVSDPGFDEWQLDFGKVASLSTSFLFLYKNNMVASFTDFMHHLPPTLRNDPAIPAYSAGLDLFFRVIDSVRGKLVDIDKQNALKKPYLLTAKLHWTSMLVLVSLAGVSAGR